MQKKEREALSLIYEALGCPFPESGMRSISVSGLSGYADDMRRVVPAVRSLIVSLGGGEQYPGELQEYMDELKSEITWK